MSNVNKTTRNISTYLMCKGDSFEVGHKSGNPEKFVVEECFTDLDEARDFAKKMAVCKNENAFVTELVPSGTARRISSTTN